MNNQQKKDVVMFFGILILFGGVVAFSIRYFKNNPTQNPFARIASSDAATSSGSQLAMAYSLATPTTTPPTAKVISKTATVTTTASSSYHLSSGTPASSTAAVAPPAPAPTKPTPPPAPTPTPAPQKPTTLSLPYSVGTFDKGFTSNSGWSNWWGYSDVSSGTLVIGATSSTTGGGVLLTGSNNWSNYTFQTTLNWNQGETFGLIARYTNDQNYLVCEYDEKNIGTVMVTVDEHLNGIVTHLATNNLENYGDAGGANITAAIQVSNAQVKCDFNGFIVTGFIPTSDLGSFKNGQVGFTTWDPNNNNSQIVVKTIGISSSIYDLSDHGKKS